MLRPYHLSDGTQVHLRPVRPADKHGLEAAFARLSAESRRLRFLGPKARLSRAELAYLTEVDGADHVALVAVPAHAPAFIIGVARYVRDREREGGSASAELAVVVGDPWQGQGLGRHMGLELAHVARRNGITRFTASMMSDNHAAHALFARISSRLHHEHHHGVEELVAELAEAA